MNHSFAIQTHERWKGHFWNFILGSEFQLSKTTQHRNKWPKSLVLLDVITLPCLLMTVSSLTHLSRKSSPEQSLLPDTCISTFASDFILQSLPSRRPPGEIQVVLCALPSQWCCTPELQITARNCKCHLVHISWFRMKTLRMTLYSTCYIFFCMILETFNFKYGGHWFIIIRKKHLIASLHDKSGNKHT